MICLTHSVALQISALTYSLLYSPQHRRLWDAPPTNADAVVKYPVVDRISPEIRQPLSARERDQRDRERSGHSSCDENDHGSTTSGSTNVLTKRTSRRRWRLPLGAERLPPSQVLAPPPAQEPFSNELQRTTSSSSGVTSGVRQRKRWNTNVHGECRICEVKSTVDD